MVPVAGFAEERRLLGDVFGTLVQETTENMD
jgi:hypothetical protein